MSVFFTSDLHLGNKKSAENRGFMSADDHDYHMTENINDTINKRDKLFILGDIGDNKNSLIKWLPSIRCQNIELIMGNHDVYGAAFYLQYVQKIHGFRGYKNYWLSHCPIHPHEMRKKTGNIHGHIHIFGDTEDITDSRYFNVNPEFNDMKPVSLEQIQARLEI
jgi:calcineurin-like phosphoesterase family protein